jgi:transposase
MPRGSNHDHPHPGSQSRRDQPTDAVGALAQARRGLGTAGADRIARHRGATERARNRHPDGIARRDRLLLAKRFNERGLKGLEEEMRSGRPPTYSAEAKRVVIRTAPTRPAELGLPLACWTLDRMVADLSEHGIGMRRSRISEILLDEGLQWRQEETWFGARVDPDVAQKRGDCAALHGPAGGQRRGFLDEMGPQASQSDPGRRPVRAAEGARATQEIDYGRRDVAGDVFGAPELVEGPAGHRSGVHRDL